MRHARIRGLFKKKKFQIFNFSKHFFIAFMSYLPLSHVCLEILPEESFTETITFVSHIYKYVYNTK